jgi:ribosomal protein S8
MSIKDASRLMASLRQELKNPKQNKEAIRNLMRVARAEIDRAKKKKELKRKARNLATEISRLKKESK